MFSTVAQTFYSTEVCITTEAVPGFPMWNLDVRPVAMPAEPTRPALPKLIVCNTCGVKQYEPKPEFGNPFVCCQCGDNL
jgi:hypothetical protein